MTRHRKKEQPYTSKLRGVAALLESTATTDNLPAKVAELVPLDMVQKASSQPRQYFDPVKQQKLEVSISQHGILEPLLVRPVDLERYEIVAGERRYLAAKALGLSEVPVVIKELSDIEAIQIALIENLQRVDLSPLEETEGILQLLSVATNLDRKQVILLLYRMQNESKGKVTQNVLGKDLAGKIIQIFDDLGRLSWDSFVNSRLPLLKLPKDVLSVLQQGKIEYTKAKAISRVKDETLRKQLFEEAIASSWSLSKIREQINKIQPKFQQEKILGHLDSTYKQLKKSRKMFLSNPKKRKKLDSLLTQIDKLLEAEN